MNPFEYGTVVPGPDFCGRKELIRQIGDHIYSSQNVVLFGERRMEKGGFSIEGNH